MGGRRESFSGYFGEEFDCCPDADSWHAGQNRIRKVRMYQIFNFERITLPALFGKLVRHARQYDAQARDRG